MRFYLSESQRRLLTARLNNSTKNQGATNFRRWRILHHARFGTEFAENFGWKYRVAADKGRNGKKLLSIGQMAGFTGDIGFHSAGLMNKDTVSARQLAGWNKEDPTQKL